MHAKRLPQLSALLQYYCRKNGCYISTALFKSRIWNDADL